MKRGLPDHRAPGGRKAEDEEGGHDDHSCARLLGVLWVIAIKREVPNGGKDEKHQEHPSGAYHQRSTAAIVLDDVETVECGAEVDTVENHLSNERIVDSSSLENYSSVVEEVVGTGELLEHLKTHSERDSVGHLWSPEHAVPFLEGGALRCLGA